MKNSIRSLFLAFAMGMLALMTGCTQISTGNVGISVTAGKVNPEELTPGWTLTGWASTYEINGKQTPIVFNDLKPKSKENLTMADFDADIYVQIDPSKAAEIYSKFVGDLVQVKDEDGYRVGFNYVTRAAREAIYTAVAEIKADEMNQRRQDIAARIQQLLQVELDAQVGKGWFSIANVNIRNIVTDPALEQAIKENAAMAYQLKKQEAQVQAAKLEADRKRAEAQGDADAIRLRAEAITKNGGAEYVQLEAIKKWDGKLPTYHGGSGPTPFINVK